VSTRVRFSRHAYRTLLNHADRVARERGAEAIGWLLGFFAPSAVTVLDVAPATRYKSQSRYGAEADPREELAIATSYPRTVGIVGLYHSHPFRDETHHAIFHSQTDDKTLKSRASRREEYLSVVTDGHDAEVFVIKGGKHEVTPEVVDGLSYKDALRRYSCDVSLRLVGSLKIANQPVCGISVFGMSTFPPAAEIFGRSSLISLDKMYVRTPGGRLSGFMSPPPIPLGASHIV